MVAHGLDFSDRDVYNCFSAWFRPFGAPRELIASVPGRRCESTGCYVPLPSLPFGKRHTKHGLSLTTDVRTLYGKWPPTTSLKNSKREAPPTRNCLLRSL